MIVHPEVLSTNIWLDLHSDSLSFTLSKFSTVFGAYPVLDCILHGLLSPISSTGLPLARYVLRSKKQ